MNTKFPDEAIPWNASFILKFSSLWDHIQCLRLMGEHIFIIE